MAGHSKWSTIKRKKGVADAARAKIFTKFGREIQVCVREGGPDPATNSALRDAIAKAKANNVPNENINRSIQKAAGAASGDQFESITYEGYGPDGVAVIVRTLSDNRNRTAGDVRHAFDKFGGNLGTTGCVSFQFENKGVLVLDREQFDDEDTVMMDALEAGAEDVLTETDSFEITTTPEQYMAVADEMEAKGYTFVHRSLGPVPLTWTRLDNPESVEKMEKMIDFLEDNDDVQEVLHNWEQD